MKLADFMNDVGSTDFGSDVLTVKDTDDGVLTVVLHTGGEFHKRKRHWLPTLVEKEDGETKRGKGKGNKSDFINMPYNCPGKDKCAVCKLIDAIRNKEVDLDDVVLTFGAGKTKQEFLAGEVIGDRDYAAGGGWQNDLSLKTEYLTTVVDVDNVDEGLQKLQMTKSQGRAVKKVIETAIDEQGEDGDPFTNPYPIRLEFDENETPAKKYSAAYSTKKIPAKALKLIESTDPLDEECQELCKPANPGKIKKLIVEALAVEIQSIEDLDVDVEDAGEEEEEVKKTSGKTAKGASNKKTSTKKTSTKKTAKIDEEDGGDDGSGDEDPDDIPVAPKGGGKKTAKKTTKKTAKKSDTPDFLEGLEEDEIDVCPLCERPIPADAAACPYDDCDAEFEDPEGDGDEDPEETEPEGDEDGGDEDGDGGEDEGGDEDPEEEKPAAKKSTKKSTKKTSKKKSDVPDFLEGLEEDDLDICPACERPIPADATACPYDDCDAEYE